MKEIVFCRGKFISAEEAVLPAFSDGALYGWGAFESMRFIKGKSAYLNEHLARLAQTCRLLNTNTGYSPVKLKQAISQVVKKSALDDIYLRISVWRIQGKKAELIIRALKYKAPAQGKYNRGFSCIVSELTQNSGSILTRVKSANYLLQQLAYAQALKKGCDEAIILNNNGYIAEASHSNIFMVKNGMLFTPALECGCLDGITRKCIMDLASKEEIPLNQGNFTLQNLYEADEAFLTNSLIGIMPVESVEGIKIGKCQEKDSLMRLLMKKYGVLLKSGN